MHDAPGPVGASGLMTLAEISQLAGVSRPAVTNWRRRFPDFPAQIGTDAARPQFDAGQVTGWLLAHNTLGHAQPSELQFEGALHSLAAYATQFEPTRLLEVTSALLCLRALDDHDEPLFSAGDGSAAGDAESCERAWARIVARAREEDEDDEFLLGEIESADASTVALARLADSLTEAAYGPANAHEKLLAARHRLGLTELTVNALAPQLTLLIAQLSGAEAHASKHQAVAFADFHAGAGDVLQALAENAGPEARIRVLAAEADPLRARLSRRRMLIRGVDYMDLDVQIGTEIQRDLAEPDIAVICLPYRVGEQRDPASVFAQIRRVLDESGDTCATTIVLGPADALVGPLAPMSQAERERQRLLDTGLAEAVVRLPGGMIPFRPGYHSSLWILRRNPVPKARGRVLLCDVSAQALTSEVTRKLTEDVRHWRAAGYDPAGHSPRSGAPIDIRELAQRPGAPLDPPRKPSVYEWVLGIDERVQAIRQAEAQLAKQETQGAGKRGPLRGVAQRRTDQVPARTTLGALITAKRIEVIAGLRLDAAHLAPGGNHAVIGTAEVAGRAEVGERHIDLLTLTANYGHAQLTRPGDLVVCLNGDVTVLVDEQGANVVEFPARVLRILEHRRNPQPTPRVLAALLEAAHGTGRAGTAVRAARKLEDFELPLLSTRDIQHYDRLLKDLNDRRALIAGQLASIDLIHGLTRRGLADGTLTVGPAPAAFEPSDR
ncbi:hypothetical protein KGA66_25125 [Actinocrinis puniceicyclus]|uniref:DNA methylase adenine-specific domain-containing protein n=1 Tax=Actinocrinis puniceicyclus TaxID=977794 RepID=A0A8J7WT95_9ACTN|nr:hypothetical protein [Actinocrinis puniceicyclus]MBS2966350.1 hypothetical protein [Actinocrinis puniceicyclus]